MERESARPSPIGRGPRPEFRRAVGIGLGVSLLAHAVLMILPPLTVDLPEHLEPSGRIVLVAPPQLESPPEVEVPVPPERVSRPAEPDVSAAGEPVPSEGAEPVFIPHDVPPRLLNSGQVQDYLSLYYPVSLRVASVEGAVNLWIFVDEGGRPTKVQVRESSGSAQFDELARSAAPLMRFRPALNRGQSVGVWVSIWVRFNIEDPPRPAEQGRLVGGVGGGGG